MTDLMDFQILQREADGYAAASFRGIYEAELTEGAYIAARVVREDDNLTVVFWTPCTLENHTWSVNLRIPEGGLYRLEACVRQGDSLWCDKIKCLYHIGVGDIFVTTGQSNMTGYGRDNAYDPPTLGVHALRNNGQWCIAAHPLADALGTAFGYPEHGTGTSPALSFARRLKERLGIPIGIIPTAVGGTPLSAWHPEQDGYCYTGMCERLERVGKYKGFVWFQGCSDANETDAPTYFDRFARMVSLWREKFGNLPVLTVQLNRWMGMNTGVNDVWWGMIRDTQRRAALELPDVYVVPSIDLPVTDGIHNSSGTNVIIGERLANTALTSLYGKPGQVAPSVLKAEKVDDTHVLIHLTPGHHVLAMDEIALGMNVEDAQGLIECREAKAVPDGLVISTARSYTLPAKYHYAWRSQPPAFVVRDFYDMPLLACYGVEIVQKTGAVAKHFC